jgi:hypothetical protein
MSSLQQLSSISKLLASSNHQKSDVYAHHMNCRKAAISLSGVSTNSN